MKLLTARQMQALDAEAIGGLGLPALVLMENAARALCVELQRLYPASSYPRVLALAGKGNNGGDAIAAVRILASRGYGVSLILLAEPKDLKPDAVTQLSIYKRLNLPVQTATRIETLRQALDCHLGEAGRTVLIDGLFGVGLTHPLEGFWAEAVNLINTLEGPVVAVDLPSGCLEEDSPGSVRVTTDLTVTFQEPKVALIRPENRACAGLVKVVDIGIPGSLYEGRDDLIRWIDDSVCAPLLAPRDPFSSKRSHGHGLAVAGSETMPGAGILAVRAALAAGIGLCTASVPEKRFDAYAVSCPEALLHKRQDPLDPGAYDALLLGPGIGLGEAGDPLLPDLLARFEGPLILDADGLNRLARYGKALPEGKESRELVMTPHAGEAARLLGRERSWVEAHRIEAVGELAKRHRATVVLKGKYSLVADPAGRIFVNPTGHAGMAVAGSGDVLAGLLLGLIAQFHGRIAVPDLVCAAVWLHGRCGELAILETGGLAVPAGGLIGFLPRALREDHGISL
jgi:NAD(P)H-hydrate epimerase